MAALTLLLLALASHGTGVTAEVVAVPQSHVREQQAPTPAEAAPAEEPLVVRLQRETIALPQPLLAVPRGVKRTKNFYSATLQVGEPKQEFRVSFDLSGGTLVLPSRSCEDEACVERKRYNKWSSDSAEDIRADGQRADRGNRRILDRLRRRYGDRGALDVHFVELGTGTISGTFVRDRVCISGQSSDDEDAVDRCFPMGFLTAQEMKGTPFHTEPYDGTVGLGLLGMSLTKDFNFLSAMRGGDQSATSFALKLVGGDMEGVAELAFGPMDERHPLLHAGAPVRWAPVADPQEGRWQVAITAVRIGNSTLEMCGGKSATTAACRAALDYGTSLLVVPEGLAPGLEAALTTPRGGFGDGCQRPSMPGIQLELEGGVTLALPAEDFVSHFGEAGADTSVCHPQLVHSKQDVETLLGKDVFVLGEATLRRYHTFYDADGLKVGFGGLPGHGQPPRLHDPADATGEPKKKDDGIIILLQIGQKGSRLQASAMLLWDD